MGVKISRLYYIDRRKDEFVILRWHGGQKDFST